MFDQSQRPFGPILAATGLIIYCIPFMDGTGRSGESGIYILAFVGAGIALAGLWLAGLDRLFPQVEPVAGLMGGILAGLGTLPVLGAMPWFNPSTPLLGRVAFLLLGAPVILAGVALTGALEPFQRRLTTRGIRPEWLMGGLAASSLALVLFAIAALAAGQGESSPALALAALGLVMLAAGGAVARLAFPILEAWRVVLEKALVTMMVSAFAAAITAVAVYATAIAWLGALILLWSAGAGWWDVGQACRRALHPPPPPLPLPGPADEGAPMQAAAPRTET